MKVKHMGLKCIWIDDQASSLRSEYSPLITDIIPDYIDSTEIANSYFIDSLANVTFDIAEESEYHDITLEKLQIDEFSGKIPKQRHRSFIPKHKLPIFNPKKKYTSPWYVRPTDWNNISKNFDRKLINEEHRLKNLYYYLHQENKVLGHNNFKETDEKYERLQETIKSLDLTSKYKKYLERKKLRLPHYLS